VVMRVTWSPEAVSLPAAYQAFRSRILPEISSLPMVIISPCIGQIGYLILDTGY
jgi:hypothetical protein